MFEPESLLWAEAKSGTRKDIYESFVQLILTIGRARTFDQSLPPAFLGAFDAEKIAFLPYVQVLDVFYQNDFNWNVAPSDHETKEFRQLYDKVKSGIERDVLLYRFGTDDKELRAFIRRNFIVGKSRLSKIRINKNNFTHVYQKWLCEVKPTIGVDWEVARKENIFAADFYLADILSEHNVTLKEKLFVLLRKDRYMYNIQRRATGALNFDTVGFNDRQVGHTQFWNRYDRPPKREYWDYIVERRDLLVPQDVRERKGSFFTPQPWVELSQQYIAQELGEDWQDEYYVWDCAAGTGNLLAGLTNKYRIWASTLDQADVDVMRDRIRNGANLLESHVFQFDFLNDSFDKLPQVLRDIIADDERRRKLVIYINPPYAEGDARMGKGRRNVQLSKIHTTYNQSLGKASSELFAQFFMRIYKEIPNSVLAEFSKLKILQAPNFSEFRSHFRAKLKRIFIVPADTFDNVKGDFPIGFMIWDLKEVDTFRYVEADVYDARGSMLPPKGIYCYDGIPLISRMLETPKQTGANDEGALIQPIGHMSSIGNDFQNQNALFIDNIERPRKKGGRHTIITNVNLQDVAVYFAVRKSIPATWLNDRDQFLYPNDGWKNDVEFQTDCLTFALFTNNIQAKYGINHWIPFTETQVNAKEAFQSHFMTDYINGKHINQPEKNSVFATELFERPISHNPNTTKPLTFSDTAQNVFEAGRKLWSYYHDQPSANPNAALYDIREYFQGRNEKGKMNNDSNDLQYSILIKNLRDNLKLLARQIEPKVYEYEFLKK